MIGNSAFEEATVLRRIRVPSSVKAIGDYAFSDCKKLVNVELCEGLEKVGLCAFEGCKSLKPILIPSTITKVGMGAFGGGFEKIAFSVNVEQLVADWKLRELWNNEVTTRSLYMLCFLGRHNFPSRLGMINAEQWRSKILRMLEQNNLRN